jgi:hypothetical protein
VLERVVGVDSALHADLRGAELDRLGNPRLEVVGGDVVGVGRALALPEAAEGAADDADVGEVDIAVDDECRRVARELGAQLVGRDPHRLDHVGPGLGEQRRELVLGELLATATALDGARCELGVDLALLAPARATTRDEAPVLELDHVEHPLLDPFRRQVLRVRAQALGQRVAPRGQLLAHLMRAGERLLGRDVVAVGRQPAEVRGPVVDQVRPPVGEIGRDLDPHAGHQPAALPHELSHVFERDRRGPVGHRLLVSQRRAVSLPSLSRRLIGDLGDLAPVVPGVWDEVLEDHLLEVSVLALDFGEGLQSGNALGRRLPYPHQDPARERDPQLARGPDRLQASLGVLGRRSLVHHQVGIDRLEHQALRRRHLAQPAQVLRGEDAKVRVGQQPPLQCPLAGPDHVGDEVLVAVLAESRRHLGVDLGRLAGEDQQLLRVAPHGLLEPFLDLVRRVEVGAMGGEGAVLAVAAARARQRQRVVAREGDAPHDMKAIERPRPVPRRRG